MLRPATGAFTANFTNLRHRSHSITLVANRLHAVEGKKMPSYYSTYEKWVNKNFFV